MEYVPLGNSELVVSRICLGCMGFGDAAKGMHSWTLDEHQSAEIIGRALDHGINYFDTAIAYQGGTSEVYLGKALKSLTTRDKVIIATKFPPQRPEDEASVSEYIAAMLEQSLANLATDYVDLFILHAWDYRNATEDIMGALNDQVRSGRVRSIGVSNCFAWQLQKANGIAERYGWSQFVSVQNHYNLLFREEEREMAPCCRDGHVAMTPYSALASGRLVRDWSETTRRLEQDAFAHGKYDATAAQDKLIVDRVAEVAARRGMTRIQIALGWLLSKVTSPVVGATRLSHIDGAIKALLVALTDEEVAYLEEPYVPHRLVGVMAGQSER